MAASKVLLKIVVLGGSKVGKTQLLRAFAQQEFVAKYTPTNVANLVPQEVRKGGRIFNLQLWDMPGNSKSMKNIQPRNLAADACILVYDTSNAKSAKALASRLEAFRGACEAISGFDSPHIIIIGTKLDTKDEDGVPLAKVKKWAAKNKIEEVFEVSAKTSKGVKQAFESLMVAEEEDFLNMDDLTAGMDDMSNRRRPKGKATAPCDMTTWVPDGDAPDCGSCGSGFNLFNRRHHCRACGDVFCNKCSNLTWEYSGERVRVCEECHSFFIAENAVMAK